MPFFVTRQVYCGAGKVGSENRAQPCDYQISQRADFFEVEVALDTMVKRPIINTRDEPHADREKYRRLHCIVGDSNMSEYTIYLRNGVTALVISMIEDGAIPDGLVLRDPVRAIKQVSHDPTCKTELALDNGKKMTAVQLQAEYLEAALRYAATRDIDPIVQDVIEKWQYVIEKLAGDPMDLHREIDWISKKKMIETFMDRKELDWQDHQVGMLDLQYHDTRPEKGLYFMLERQGRVERIVTDEEIAAAVYNPPKDTRAYFRGECLRRYPAEVFGVNWDSISFGVEDQPVKRIMMSEPLKGTAAHVEDLLDSSSTAADLVSKL
jgi:proteasome accessory factor A